MLPSSPSSPVTASPNKVKRQYRGNLAYKAGLEAEETALAYFQAQGFELLARRQRTPLGEIDLIVANAYWLIAVEVKKRRNIKEYSYALSPKQAERLLAALAYYLELSPEHQRANTRFDVMLFNQSYQLYHIKDALRLF